jgi:hypothetical protein
MSIAGDIAAEIQREADEVEINALKDNIASLENELRAMEARKDAAYLERNMVVAALAKCFPSGVIKTAIEGWSEDWHGCVYVDLPTGASILALPRQPCTPVRGPAELLPARMGRPHDRREICEPRRPGAATQRAHPGAPRHYDLHPPDNGRRDHVPRC